MMNTLIIYASKYGCVEKCAKLLKEKLEGKVELCNIKNSHLCDLSKFDQIIIGGSIYVGRIQKGVYDFCLNNLNALLNKKVGLFINCLNVGEGAQKELESSFPKELLDHAKTKSSFGGEIVFKKLKFLDRLMTNMVSKSKDANFPKLDENKNVCMIHNEKIEKFVNEMNN